MSLQLSELPSEIITDVAKNMSPSDLAARLAPTCTEFADIAAYLLDGELSLTQDGLPDDVSDVLFFFKNVSTPITSLEVFADQLECPRLRWRIGAYLSNLETLVIKDRGVLTYSDFGLFEFGTSTMAKLSRIYMPGVEMYGRWALGLSILPSLTYLNTDRATFGRCGRDETDVYPMMCRTLQTFSASQRTSASFNSIAAPRYMSCWRNARSINLSKNRRIEEDVLPLETLSQCMPFLSRLDLADIGGLISSRLFEALSGCTALSTLDVSGASAERTFQDADVALLKDLQELRFLNISGAQRVNGAFLAEGFLRLRNLQVENTGMAPNPAVFAGNTGLKIATLNIAQCPQILTYARDGQLPMFASVCDLTCSLSFLGPTCGFVAAYPNLERLTLDQENNKTNLLANSGLERLCSAPKLKKIVAEGDCVNLTDVEVWALASPDDAAEPSLWFDGAVFIADIGTCCGIYLELARRV